LAAIERLQYRWALGNRVILRGLDTQANVGSESVEYGSAYSSVEMTEAEFVISTGNDKENPAQPVHVTRKDNHVGLDVFDLHRSVAFHGP
jgi:hypothetical protein